MGGDPDGAARSAVGACVKTNSLCWLATSLADPLAIATSSRPSALKSATATACSEAFAPNTSWREAPARGQRGAQGGLHRVRPRAGRCHVVGDPHGVAADAEVDAECLGLALEGVVGAADQPAAGAIELDDQVQLGGARRADATGGVTVIVAPD